MQITETNVEGLVRELKVVVGAEELERRLSTRLDELKDRVRIKGFRPGRVPKDHLRRVYGRSVMAEVVQQAVAETSQEALQQRQERPAFQPRIQLPEDETEVGNIFAGAGDLAYTMHFEVLPKVDLTDFGKIEVERPVAPVTPAHVDDSLKRLQEANPRYEAKAGEAAKGDRLTIDFVGTLDGEAFKGGSAEDAQVLLGSGNFIPGFEEGLIGSKAGDDRNVEATFPENYPEASLSGKKVNFAVKVKEVASPSTPTADDEFAKGLGLESLDQLRDMVKQRLEQDRGMASRMKVKRALLDVLNENHDFALPPTLVDNEFQGIWQQTTDEMTRTKRSFEDEGTTEEKAKEEYRGIAERRVRLGLVLSEVGMRNKIEVSDEEVNRALLERVRQFPGQERQVYEFYQKNPQALAEIRAPLYEDKVIDFILELAKVKEKDVTPEELYADLEAQGGPDHGHEHHNHDHDHHGHDHHHHDHDHDHDHHHDHGHGHEHK
jgi:trigger factor